MLVICPKCFTRYVISDEIKVPEGQNFHCSACGNYFTLKSNRQTGFYGEDAIAAAEEIPTVSAVMNESPHEETENNAYRISLPADNKSSLSAEIQNESNPKEKNGAHFSDAESMAFLSNEAPQVSDRLETLPEAFKPITNEKKKTSFIGTVFWLCVAGGICYGTFYLLRQYPLMEKTEAFIASKLDKNNAKAAEKNEINVSMAQKAVPEQEPLSVSKPVSDITQKVDLSISAVSEPTPRYIPPLPLKNPVISVEEAKTHQPPQAVQVAQTPPLNTSFLTPSPALSVENSPEKTSEQSAQGSDSIGADTVRLLNEQLNQSIAEKNLENEVATLAERHQLNDRKTQTDLAQANEPSIPPKQTDQPVKTVQYAAVPSAAGDTVPLFQAEETEQAVRLNRSDASRILKIRDISYELSPNEAGIMRLMIKGSVANTELTKVVIPELKAIVYDQNDTPVARKRIILSQPEINGNSVQTFFSSVVPAPEQISHVEVVFDE